MEKSKQLTYEIITQLEKQGNVSLQWENVSYRGTVEWSLIRNCFFSGQVILSELLPGMSGSGEFIRPRGIVSCRLDNVTIGKNVSLYKVSFLQNMVIGNGCILEDCGAIRGSSDFQKQSYLELGNENGGRRCPLYPDLTSLMVSLMISCPEDESLQKNQLKISEKSFKSYPGNSIGKNAVLIQVQSLRNVFVGNNVILAHIKQVESVVFKSREKRSFAVEGALELKNGVCEGNSRIGFGVIARNFFLSDGSFIVDSARIIHVFISSNSHIGGCEIQNALLFPFHEQHHSNSFLIAARIEGQSNIAAGAVLGSNHNSRRNDCELLAERGFWPSLNVSLKHNSRFAPFSVLVKGDYPQEIDNPYPFSLVANDESRKALIIIPAYWFIYNPYALFRNSVKFKQRDNRLDKSQPAAEAFLAPDTVTGIIHSIIRLKSLKKKDGEFRDDHLERGNRPVLVRKVEQTVLAYREMLLYYAVTELLSDFPDTEIPPVGDNFLEWKNLGGMLFSRDSVNELIGATDQDFADFKKTVNSLYMNDLLKRKQFALSVLSFYCSDFKKTLSIEDLLREYLILLDKLEKDVFENRKKDYQDPFRKNLFSSEKEMITVMGDLEEDPLFKIIQEDFEEKRKIAKKIVDQRRSPK